MKIADPKQAFPAVETAVSPTSCEVVDYVYHPVHATPWTYPLHYDVNERILKSWQARR